MICYLVGCVVCVQFVDLRVGLFGPIVLHVLIRLLESVSVAVLQSLLN